jgi:hypothetical protein
MLLAFLMVAIAVTCVLGLFLIWRRRRDAADEPWPRSERLTLTGVVVSATVSLVTLLVNTLYGGSGTSAAPTSRTTTTPASTVTPAAGTGGQASSDTDLRVSALTISDADEQNQGPTLDIRLRNVGPHVSALTAVTLTVRTFGILDVCEAGGFSSPTASYPVAMPVPAEPGTVVTAPISQDLPANTADNFQLLIGVAPIPATISPARAYFVYLVDVAVIHDGDATPLPAGSAVLMVPADGTQAAAQGDGYAPFLVDEDAPDFAEQGYAEGPVLDCYRANRALLTRARKSDSAQPPSLVRTPGLSG